MFATCSWPSLCEQSELQCWRPILRRKKRVIRPFKVRIGNLSTYTKLSIYGREQRYLRPRVVLPSAASRAAFGREQHYSRPQIDNV